MLIALKLLIDSNPEWEEWMKINWNKTYIYFGLQFRLLKLPSKISLERSESWITKRNNNNNVIKKAGNKTHITLKVGVNSPTTHCAFSSILKTTKITQVLIQWIGMDVRHVKKRRILHYYYYFIKEFSISIRKISITCNWQRNFGWNVITLNSRKRVWACAHLL